jgi:amidohydrolase
MNLLDRARELQPQITNWRRDIHMHPELGFQEHRTAQLVAETLRGFGLHVETGVGKTGVVGSVGDGAPLVAIRADMDALPLQEENQVSYASDVSGVMHACGHDAHTAMALGAAKLWSEIPDRPVGTIRFLFQPSEERMDSEGKGGARRMIEAGALAGVDAILALHVNSGLPSGRVWVVPGYCTAFGDYYEATITGAGGHDAFPHLATDPIYIAAQVVTAIHGIRSRRIDPLQPALVSVGTFHGGESGNIIPGSVKITGTIRGLDDEVREQLAQELERTLALARTLGGDYQLMIRRGVPSTINDARLVATFRQAVVEMLGTDALSPGPPGLYAEDFSYMTRKAPGLFAMLGVQRGAETRALHSSTFDLDESVLPVGSALLIDTACRLLQQGLPKPV